MTAISIITVSLWKWLYSDHLLRSTHSHTSNKNKIHQHTETAKSKMYNVHATETLLSPLHVRKMTHYL